MLKCINLVARKMIFSLCSRTTQIFLKLVLPDEQNYRRWAVVFPFGQKIEDQEQPECSRAFVQTTDHCRPTSMDSHIERGATHETEIKL